MSNTYRIYRIRTCDTGSVCNRYSSSTDDINAAYDRINAFENRIMEHNFCTKDVYACFLVRGKCKSKFEVREHSPKKETNT
jgi:hypothetical protein